MYSTHEDINFLGFEKREELKNIWRYSSYPDVWYRSNVWNHSIRVFYEVSSMQQEIQEVFPKIDFRKIQVLSLIHDDAEILIGDFQAGNRNHMTVSQLKEIDKQEANGIEAMRKIFPEKIEWYNYWDLLFEIYKKETLESQMVKFFDHIDAFCEALHEFFAGNDNMLHHVENEYGSIVLPVDYYIERCKQWEKYYPKLQSIFKYHFKNFSPFWLNFPRWDFEGRVWEYSVHTQDISRISTWYELYDWWKEIIFSTKKQELTKNLIDFSPKKQL